MTPRKKREEKIKELLDGYAPLTQLELFCDCYGYRSVEGKLLYFSVYERLLLQKKQFNEANTFLRKVVEQADKEHTARESKRRAARLQELEPVEPPKPRQYSATVYNLLEAAETYRPLFAPVKVPGHPYWEVVEVLEEQLERYPRVVWQKIKIERECVEDERIDRTVRRQRQGVRRTLQKLVASGDVIKDEDELYRKA